jgi:hypothetical protein
MRRPLFFLLRALFFLLRTPLFLLRTPLFLLMICAPSLLAQRPETTATERTQPLAHVSSSFAFTVNAAMRDAAPLFGPEGERVWAGADRDPQFVFPVPAQDVEGAVFTIRHGEHSGRDAHKG